MKTIERQAFRVFLEHSVVIFEPIMSSGNDPFGLYLISIGDECTVSGWDGFQDYSGMTSDPTEDLTDDDFTLIPFEPWQKAFQTAFDLRFPDKLTGLEVLEILDSIGEL